MNERYTVNITFLHSGDTFQSVIEDTTPPRYEGTMDEALEIVLFIARHSLPARTVEESPLKWTIYALNGEPAETIEIVPTPPAAARTAPPST